MADRSSGSRSEKPRAPRQARAEKAVETERRLLDAAARVVGAEGYANASVAKITALAEVAQGTFYNYFQSQQDLFDHLLPELGGELLDFVRTSLDGVEDSLAREEAGFRAFFEFLTARPEFYRILNEAETFAPKAFRAHMRNMADGYLRALRRSYAKGEMPGYEPRELEVVVYTLLAARNYIAYRWMAGEGRGSRLPSWVPAAYMKLVTGGVRHGGIARPARPRAAPARAAATPPASPRIEHVRKTAPGRAEIELEPGAGDVDDNGAIRPAALAGLMHEAAALAAGVGRSDSDRRLDSLSIDFLASAVAKSLVAIAAIEGEGRSTHVAVRVHAEAVPDHPIALGRAAFVAVPKPGRSA